MNKKEKKKSGKKLLASVEMAQQAKGLWREVEEERHKLEPANETQPTPAAI